jgi:hypothetical protein
MRRRACARPFSSRRLRSPPIKAEAIPHPSLRTFGLAADCESVTVVRILRGVSKLAVLAVVSLPVVAAPSSASSLASDPVESEATGVSNVLASNASREVFAFPPLKKGTTGGASAAIVSGDPQDIIGSGPAPITASTGRYQAVTPTRIVDTRSALGFARKLAANETAPITVIGGPAAVPAIATAVVLNVTMTDPLKGGYLTAWGAGDAQPNASIINVEQTGQTIANLVTVPVGAGGVVNVFSSVASHVIIDVQGFYVPAPVATAGRFVPLNPTRILDTRNSVKVAPGTEIVVDVATPVTLAADTAAAVLKVTVTDASGEGYWTVYPNAGTRPTVSNLNAARAGDTISNQAIVPLSAGKVRVFAERGGNVIIDIVGSYTGASAPSTTDGLFTPVSPGRVIDTREGNQKLGLRRTVEVPIANRFGVPGSGVAAVVLNATLAPSTNAGFLTLWPARTYRPGASSLNANSADQTIAGHVITPVTANGFALFSDGGGQVIADVSGWFAGTPVAAVTPPAVPLFGPAGPSGAPSSDSYTFQASLDAAGVEHTSSQRNGLLGPTGSPYRWNPCSVVKYRVNLGGYGEQFRPVIEEAFDRLSSVTGISFVYNGDTTYMPFDSAFNDDATAEPFEVSPIAAANRTAPYDLLVALGSSEASNGLVGVDGVLGVTYINWSRFGSKVGRINVSSVTIDMPGLGPAVWGYGGLGPVLLHEFAHVVGLSHVRNDQSQIMYPAVTNNFTFQDGDLRGLWREGQGGCL